MTDVICDDPSELAALTSPTRNRYFYGKLLDVFHFQLEQSYNNRKRWLVNRLGLGTGVLCGLAVAPSNDGSGIVVGPGVAVDPYGREITVPGSSIVVDPRQPTDACGNPFGDPVDAGTVVTICLAYHECETEPVPAMVCDCDGQDGCEASSIRERYMVLVQAQEPPAVDLSCNIDGLFAAEQGGGLSISYPPLVSRVSASCPEPAGACIPLATVTTPGAGEAITADMIDVDVRPIVYSNELLFEMIECLASESGGGGGGNPPPAQTLTHIAKISWKHDGAMSLGEFMSGLKVAFDAPVPTGPSSPHSWFLVSFEFPVNHQFSPESPFLQHSIAVVRVLDAQTVLDPAGEASFQPDKETETLIKLISIQEVRPLVRVQILCDFLVDDNGLAVDGNFLGGQLPSGDGTAGGTFESWFTLEF
jgi:hypothetical protein